MRHLSKNKGFSLVELMIVVAIIAILSAIAIPNMVAARRVSNEATTVSTMRTISTAIEQFRTFQTTPSYPAGLANLLDPNNDGVQSDALIDTVLAAGTKCGYLYAYVPADPDGDGDFDSFALNVDPAQVGVTGERHFYLDDSGVIRMAIGAQAGPGDAPLE